MGYQATGNTTLMVFPVYFNGFLFAKSKFCTTFATNKTEK